MDWFTSQFGRDRLHGEVVLPTPDFFPENYQGRAEDVRAVVDRLCAHMGVDPDTVVLEYPAVVELPHVRREFVRWECQGAAWHHQPRGDRLVIKLQEEQARWPVELVAMIAHDLGHALLLGEVGIGHERKDLEPLTDLLTVFVGLGIFTANAAFDYRQEIRPGVVLRTHPAYVVDRRISRLGYLTEPMFGYGLARYAWMRREMNPPWARYLDTNPRAFLRRGLRYLRRTRPAA